MHAKKFLLWIFLSLFAVLSLLTMFNWLINPTGLFESPSIHGWNQYKTYFFYRLYVSKPYVLQRVKPDGLILGSSRAAASMRTQHPAWDGYRTYNAALPGSTAFIQLQSIRYAMLHAKLRRVVLPIDFLMFNSCDNHAESAHMNGYAKRTSRSFLQRLPQMLQDYLDALISFDALQRSIKTIRSQARFSQRKQGQMYLEFDGFWHAHVPRNQRLRKFFQRVEGHYLQRMWSPPPAHCYQLEPRGEIYQIGYFAEILELAYQNDLETYLYFSPVHARLLEAMRLAGLWPTFEHLKRQLVALNSQLAERYKRPAFPLWDFSGYSSVTTEPVPMLDQHGVRMDYFFDPTHATPLTGKFVQDVMFGFSAASVPAGFGELLEPDNIEQALERDRARRELWAASHLEDIAEVARQLD